MGCGVTDGLEPTSVYTNLNSCSDISYFTNRVRPSVPGVDFVRVKNNTLVVGEAETPFTIYSTNI